MLTLLNFDWIWDFLLLDPETGKTECFENELFFNPNLPQPENWTGDMHGFYATRTDSGIYMVYDYDGLHFFRDGGIVIELDQRINSELYLKERTVLLKLYRGSIEIYSGEQVQAVVTNSLRYQAEYACERYNLLKRLWGPNIQEHLRNLLEIALSVPGMNLREIKMLCERSYSGDMLREKALDYVDNPELNRYLDEIFPHTNQEQLERVASKIAPFLKNKQVGRIFYERENAFRFREIIDTGKIFLANIPSGILGGDASNLLCSTLASCFYHAALSRQDIPEEDRREFSLMIDEYQRITTRDSEDALRECRKHNLALYVAFQQHGQMPDPVRAALAQCGVLVAFDVGLEDAKKIFQEFYGDIPVKNLMRKGERKAFCMIDGNSVNLETYPAPEPLKRNYIREIQENCRQLYYVPRAEAEYYKVIKESRAERSKKRRKRKPNQSDQYDEVSI